MNLEITHTDQNRFSVLVNNDFYVYVDLDHSTAEDTSERLEETEMEHIYAEVEKYSTEMRAEKENPYEKYGVSERQFLSR